MTAEHFYNYHYAEERVKDPSEQRFDFYDMIDFASQYYEYKLKEKDANYKPKNKITGRRNND